MPEHPTIDVFESVAEGTELTVRLASDDWPDVDGAAVARSGHGFSRPHLQEVSGRFCRTVTNADRSNELVLKGEQYQYEIPLRHIDEWGNPCSECDELGPPGEPCPTCDSEPNGLAFTTGAELAARKPAHGNTTR